MAAHKGAYNDGIVVKRSRVVAAVIESTGGQSPSLRSQMRSLAERTKGKGTSDSTNYGHTRISTRSFLEHHTQCLSLAAWPCLTNVTTGHGHGHPLKRLHAKRRGFPTRIYFLASVALNDR